MNSLTVDIHSIRAQKVKVTVDELIVELSDGRTIAIPLAWYPRLMYATKRERNRWELIANGVGIHWHDIDEDISVEGIILGKPSYESQHSFSEWLKKRNKPSNRKKKLLTRALALQE